MKFEITRLNEVKHSVAILTLTLLQPIGASGKINFITLPGFQDPQNYAFSQNVSGDGSITVGTARTSNSDEATIWNRQGVMTVLPQVGEDSGFPQRIAYAANHQGSVVVGQAPSATGYNNAVRWTQDGRVNLLGSLDSGRSSVAYNVDSSGNTVVGSTDDPKHFQQAFRWTEETGMVGLGFLHPDGDRSYAYGVSGDGQVVVGISENGNGSEAFRWTQESGMIGLGYLPGGDFSNALGVSADGNVVVGSSTSLNGREAIMWDSTGGLTSLGFLSGGSFSIATDANADGSVIVGRAYGGGEEHPFVWDAENGMRSLIEILEEAGFALEGWDFGGPTYISDDGSIITGTGINPDSY